MFNLICMYILFESIASARYSNLIVVLRISCESSRPHSQLQSFCIDLDVCISIRIIDFHADADVAYIGREKIWHAVHTLTNSRSFLMPLFPRNSNNAIA